MGKKGKVMKGKIPLGEVDQFGQVLAPSSLVDTIVPLRDSDGNLIGTAKITKNGEVECHFDRLPLPVKQEK